MTNLQKQDWPKYGRNSIGLADNGSGLWLYNFNDAIPTPSPTPVPGTGQTSPFHITNRRIKNGFVTIACELACAQSLKITLYSLSGRRVYSETRMVAAGKSLWKHDLANIGNGTYWVVLSGSEKLFEIKIVVLN